MNKQPDSKDHRSISSGGKIPAWMLSSFGKDKDTETINLQGSKTSFLRKTMKALSGVFQNELYNERHAGYAKLLQSLDPRVRLVTIVAFMVLCGTVRNIAVLLLLSGISAYYVWQSGLQMRRFVKRVWLILPLIVLIVSIPAATSLVIKGKPLFYLSDKIYISVQGLESILKMALRTGASLSYGYVLVMTSRWSHLTRSLRVFRIPALFIAILDMAYRYIFVLSKTAGDMMEARFLRTVGSVSNKSNRQFVAQGISFLFVKSSFISEDIYHAMQCRGYTGEPVSLKQFRVRRLDRLWLAGNILVMIILTIGDVVI